MADVADVQEDGGSDMAGFFKMMRGKNLESVVNEAAYVQRILEEQQRRKTLLQERGLDVLEERKY